MSIVLRTVSNNNVISSKASYHSNLATEHNFRYEALKVSENIEEQGHLLLANISHVNYCHKSHLLILIFINIYHMCMYHKDAITCS